MLVKNAQNLMQAVIRTIQDAEAAYMKASSYFIGSVTSCWFNSLLPQGLKPRDDSTAEFDSAALAIEWKRKLYIQRTMETINAPMGVKGLRRLNKRNRYSTPTLAELLSPSRHK